MRGGRGKGAEPHHHPDAELAASATTELTKVGQRKSGSGPTR